MTGSGTSSRPCRPGWTPLTHRQRRPTRADEADELEGAFGAIGGSGEPFDQRFRDHVHDVHGISLANGMTIPEPILDYDREV
jgi:hypothetical protein